jgi:hypothetical protein
MVRLRWGPDWSLQPEIHVPPTQFLDGCEVTAADIDVSPLIDKLFRERMEGSLRTAFDALAPSLRTTRSDGARYWAALQNPVELTPGLWLSAEPLALALASPWGKGYRLQTGLGLVLLLALGSESAAAVEPRRLPPLQTFFPRGTGMRFDLAVDVDMEDLGGLLTRLVAGKTLVVDDQETGIRRVDLRGEGGELVLNAELTGYAAGSIDIRAQPIFDTQEQTIGLQGLDFVFEPDDPAQALVVNLVYQRIQKVLQDGANELLATRMDAVRGALESALSRALPKHLEVDISSVRLSTLSLALNETAVRLRGAATGSLVVSTRE